MKRATYVLLTVLTIIALDQITKYLIVTRLSPFDSIEIFSFLHIVSVRNTGAAFGTFKSLGSSFFIIVSVFAIIFVVYLLMKRTYNTLGLSLVLGGAIGNLTDRIFYGNVVDFVDFSIGTFHWPAFNVADSSLSVGIIIILLTSLFKK
ncbi:MAG: signal peptidase II [Nitrospira sp.]|nr:signal peptidase II [Nitrospira sp.]